MEATKPFEAKGSFGIPEPMKRQMERRPVPATALPPKMPEQPAQPKETEEEKKEDSDQQRILADKKLLEEQFEIKISASDLRDYIFNGRLVKKDIFITSVPKDDNTWEDFKVVFQSQTPTDVSTINRKLAEFRDDKERFTPEGLENERALLVLSMGLLEINGKQIGATSEDRYKNISKMGTRLVDLIVEGWKGFNALINFSLLEKKLLKK
jgi:actin-related protein